MAKTYSPALLASCVLAGAVVAGCGSNDEASTTTNLNRSAAASVRDCPTPASPSYSHKFRFRNETSVPVVLNVNPQSWECQYRESKESEGYTGTDNPDALNGLMVPAGGEASRTLEYSRAKSRDLDWGGFTLSFYGVVNGKPRIMPINGFPSISVRNPRYGKNAYGGSISSNGYWVSLEGDDVMWTKTVFRTTLPTDQQANLKLDAKAPPDGKNVDFTISPR